MLRLKRSTVDCADFYLRVSQVPAFLNCRSLVLEASCPNPLQAILMLWQKLSLVLDLSLSDMKRLHEIFELYDYKILNLCFIMSLGEFVSENGYS